mmetsp:Transcript_3582/g.5295  ORF Transcript_3582/g.5295 Transcript_3582/m.5295 type:complete len:212 (-) Transcript_3582:1182-1817(-)
MESNDQELNSCFRFSLVTLSGSTFRRRLSTILAYRIPSLVSSSICSQNWIRAECLGTYKSCAMVTRTRLLNLDSTFPVLSLKREVSWKLPELSSRSSSAIMFSGVVWRELYVLMPESTRDDTGNMFPRCGVLSVRKKWRQCENWSRGPPLARAARTISPPTECPTKLSFPRPSGPAICGAFSRMNPLTSSARRAPQAAIGSIFTPSFVVAA